MGRGLHWRGNGGCMGRGERGLRRWRGLCEWIGFHGQSEWGGMGEGDRIAWVTEGIAWRGKGS